MEAKKQLQTVVVATDFSRSADAALDWAVELAKPHAAKVLLLHALVPPVPPIAAPEFVPLPCAAAAADRERVELELNARLSALREKGVDASVHACVGAPVNVILYTVEESRADVVVAGTRGLTGAKRVFLGSTAAQLVRRAPVPVLTVHSNQLAEQRPIRTILVPTDFSDDAELAVEEAVRVLGSVSEGAQVRLLHVYRIQPEVVYPWTPPHVAFRASEVVAQATQRMEKLAEPIRRLGFEVEILVREGFPPDVIEETAETTRADLIAMGTHGRSFLPRLVLGSVAERILPSAPCPVLTVHHLGPEYAGSRLVMPG